MYNGPMLTQELLHALFEYRENGTLIRKVTTNPRAPAGEPSGCPNKAGYLRTRVSGALYLNHRLIWFMHHGTWPSVVDHINGNKQDNRLENLRACNQSQNMQNCKNKKSNKTGVKGVQWREDKQKYRARITVDRKEYFVGYFLTLDEARDAITAAREHYHKDFANHGT
jgi:hypothetical protein